MIYVCLENIKYMIIPIPKIFLSNKCILLSSVAVFRQGDIGTNWYAVLSGSLDVSVNDTQERKVCVRCHAIPLLMSLA